LAVLAGVSTTQAAPAVSGSQDATELARHHFGLQGLVQYEDAHVVDGNLNFIDPCWLVGKRFFDSPEAANYGFQVTVRYLSRGHTRVVHQKIALRDVVMVDPNDTRHDHGAFDTTQWYRVRTTIDVSNHPIDANSETTGSVRLVNIDGADGDDANDASVEPDLGS